MEITQYSNKQEINGPNLACCMCIQMAQEGEIEAALKLPLYNHEFPQAFNLFPFFFYSLILLYFRLILSLHETLNAHAFGHFGQYRHSLCGAHSNHLRAGLRGVFGQKIRHFQRA